MKHVIAVLWQTGLLIIAAFAGFIAGMLFPAIQIQHVMSQTMTHVRTYDFNWILAVLLVYVVLILIGAVTKQLRPMLITATVALVITIVGLVAFTQIGIKEVSIS